MNRDILEQQKATRRIIIVLFCIIASILFLITLNISGLYSNLQQQTKRYLDHMAEEAVDIVNERVFYKTQEVLHVIAFGLEGKTTSEIATYLERVQVENDFSGLLLFAEDGRLICSSNEKKTIYPATLEEFYNVVDGDVKIDYFHSHKTLIYMIPVKSVSGVLVGFRSIEDIQELLKDENFGTNGVSGIIDQCGTVIIAPEENALFIELAETFAALEEKNDTKYADKMNADLTNGKSGELKIELPKSGDVIVRYTYMTGTNWFLITVVPENVISKDTRGFAMLDMILLLGIIAGFSGVFFYILYISRKYQREWETLAFVDTVTDGNNSVKFQIDAEEKIKHNPLGTYAMVAMNVKDFKVINELYGSQEGNRVLRHIYQMTYLSIDKEQEVLSRGSADRFYLLLRFTTKEEIQQRLRTIVKQINAFNETAKEPYFLTINFGVFVIEEALDLITIQDRANIARKNTVDTYHLYHIKFFEEAEQKQILEEKELSNLMEKALEEREFKVFLQPKIRLQDRKVAGAEALVRWIHPTKGMIFPSVFIPAFEKNGFITKLDLYMFEAVCQLLQRWQEEGRELLPISVNLSRKHLKNPQFMERFREIFERYSIPANLIELELTESILFGDAESLSKIIDEIHKIGFLCSLDDFGAGYSSLGALKDLEVDILKLDKGFFDDKGHDSRGESVIETIIDLSKRLHMETVAEGIESCDQVEFLDRMGCTKIQGYIFSKPCAIAEFEAFAYDGLQLRTLKESQKK